MDSVVAAYVCDGVVDDEAAIGETYFCAVVVCDGVSENVTYFFVGVGREDVVWPAVDVSSCIGMVAASD